eukprot:CAMPEP_0172296894 /NCGR_PEP_ID=MMETSP1058-20130122/87_1 /TAXON_ID=83371 /ORGANISM="Detonula confervacea, Strain CCMP 353" /LENGTH=754 /DNA_ID=CAMNT_0013005969 /DNA_START=112 /DNA_END=2376 /DNA_ORIENTATION=-
MCQPQRGLFRRWSSRASKGVFGGSFAKDTLDAASSADAAVNKNTKSPYDDEIQQTMGRFSCLLTIKFISITILLSTAAAFSVGCVARIVLLSDFDLLPVNHYDIATHIYSTDSQAALSKRPSQLPAPTIIPGKTVPFTTYASKTFRVEGSSSSHTLHIDRRSAATTVTSDVNEDLVDIRLEEDDDEVVNDYSHNDDSDELHLPAGQHLLVDIKDVDSAFLNSEERLATAMVELIKKSKLTLLSYHCHSLVPIGVSCAGVLLESHVAFHTWPKEGVITMDLFTCGGNPLIPVLSDIQDLFGVRRTPAEGEDEQDIPDPTMLWSHKLRGFREDFAPGYSRERNPLDQDLGRFVLGKHDLDVKNQIVSAKTAFQTVDVYDVMDPQSKSLGSYHKSLSGDGSYESNHPEQFLPDRVLFLDGVIQSTLYGDAPYHESIVHPAMITHPNPKRVAIIGGGEGATLREVLKHSTVEDAVMIEIDEGVVDLSKEHLPQWQDCSSIAHHEKAAEWCFDDERVDARFEDAMAYFIDNFPDEKEQEEKAYDVIIMDALDPNDDIEFAVELYTSDTYIQSLYNALTMNGILVVQVGEVPEENSPADETGAFKNRSVMKGKLEGVGFKSIHVYEEAHSGFLAPWSTLVAFKDIQARENWYRNSAEIELQLQKRILPTKSGRSSLRNFDGATMSSYQLPSSAFETVHCRQEDAPRDCDQTIGLLGSTAANETAKSVAYNPVIERHARESLHSREYASHNIQGWKEGLLN